MTAVSSSVMVAERLQELTSAYMPIGDITVAALSIIMFALLSQTFVKRDSSFRLTMGMLISVFISSCANLFFQTAMKSESYNLPFIYTTRIIHYLFLCGVTFLYIIYLEGPLWIRADRKKFDPPTLILFIIAILIDIAATVGKKGFYLGSDGSFHSELNIFIVVYVMLNGTVFYSTIKHRERLIKQVFSGMMTVNIVSVSLMLVQFLFGQTSYTDVACFCPIIGIIFLFHSNPYDVETGAVSESYFCPEHDKLTAHGKQFAIMSCRIIGFSAAIKTSEDFRLEFNGYFRRNVRKGVLYRFPDDRLVLSIPAEKDIDNVIRRMCEEFLLLYDRFHLDYKLVILKNNREIESSSDYIKLIEFAETKIPVTSVHYIDETDIKGFYSTDYILGELRNIATKRDLNDPRVLVFCQPVLNLSTRSYDTAEALMRLELDKTGTVYPDVFIPLAEQNDFIHALSLIILNKTCKAISDITAGGYDIQRISVNFSVIDLRYSSFCNEVREIITSNGIAFDKIAVEITESRSESDFDILKQRVIELREMGIKFYLDDFGTGYSNFERIMEIPFDTIKFDRSMLIESARSRSGEFMVKTFAGMFAALNYSVLFEGVEDERDEQQCIQMQASYLQGYKYSRPIPIDQLNEFLERRSS